MCKGLCLNVSKLRICDRNQEIFHKTARFEGMKTSNHSILLLLRWATVAVFLGRGWLHLFWEVPYGTIWWDESWMKGIAHAMGMSWGDWMGSEGMAAVVAGWQMGVGIVFIGLAVLSAFLQAKHPKALGRLLWLGSLLLFFLAFVSYKSHNYLWPQWWEHTAQFSVPLFLYWAIYRPPVRRYQWLLRIAIAVTFTCHGLYALGWPYDTPANFLQMTMNILPLEEYWARLLLQAAGALDLLVSVAIFLPTSGRTALVYAIIWGSLTALARVLAYVDLDETLLDLHRWLPETILRAPHAVLPLVVWRVSKESQGKSTEEMGQP